MAFSAGYSLQALLSPQELIQRLMLFNTFIRVLAEGMERKFLAWQGGVALGWVPKGTGDWLCGVFKACLGSLV